MIYRIIDKETKLFLRDDFTFNPSTEIGLDVTPAQGFIKPKWHEFEVALEGEQPMQHDGVLGEWVEAETQSEGV